MAAVTWKNIAPSNPSGILNAANQAAQGMSEGLGTIGENINQFATCLLYTSPSPRDRQKSRMPSSA